jgi:anthranilate synthase component 1
VILIGCSHRFNGDGVNPETVKDEYMMASKRITGLIARLRGPLPEYHSSSAQVGNGKFSSNIGQSGCENMVRILKEHIREGDIILAVPSQVSLYIAGCVHHLICAVVQRMSRAVSSSAFDSYRQLRIVNPSPYLFFFEFNDLEVVGASPEMLVRFEPEKRLVITHPIAGTRRRGDSDAADASLAEVERHAFASCVQGANRCNTHEHRSF